MAEGRVSQGSSSIRVTESPAFDKSVVRPIGSGTGTATMNVRRPVLTLAFVKHRVQHPVIRSCVTTVVPTHFRSRDFKNGKSNWYLEREERAGLVKGN